MKKIIALVLSAALVFCLVACGSSSSGSGGATSAANETKQIDTQTWGNLNVYVPAGFKIVGGDLLSKDNKDALTLQNEQDPTICYVIKTDTKENIEMGMEMLRDVNSDCEFVEMALECQNGPFTGFSYDSYGIPCSGLMGTLSNGLVQVNTSGIDLASEDFVTVLASLSINK